jgi:Flp pilus assembly protein protease CpaA
MGVTFLGHVVAWDGKTELLQFGLATSSMIAVLTFFLWVVEGARAKALKAKAQDDPPTPED